MPFFPPWGRKSCPPKGLLDPTLFFLGLSQWVLPGVLALDPRAVVPSGNTFGGCISLGVDIYITTHNSSKITHMKNQENNYGWEGVTTTRGTVFNGGGIRKAENWCSR